MGFPWLGGSREPCAAKKLEMVCKSLSFMSGSSFRRLPVLPGSRGHVLQLRRGTAGGPGTDARLSTPTVVQHGAPSLLCPAVGLKATAWPCPVVASCCAPPPP